MADTPIKLADFARQIGVNPATARQWKKRGKIVERNGGFELIAEAQREWVGLTPPPLAEDQSHWEVKPCPYEPLPLVTDCPECHGARWACEHTPLEQLTTIEVLLKDNRILSDAVDSLRDLTTEQGMTISRLTARIEALEAAQPRPVDGSKRFEYEVNNCAMPWVTCPCPDHVEQRARVGGKSNYTGSTASVGERFDDGQASPWGA